MLPMVSIIPAPYLQVMNRPSANNLPHNDSDETKGSSKEDEGLLIHKTNALYNVNSLICFNDFPPP